MKTKREIIIGILFLLIQSSYAQKQEDWKKLPYNLVWYDWTIDLNVGVTSYFGDLSIYDLNPAKKLTHESKAAFGVKLTKNIYQNFGIAGQFIYGGFKNSDSDFNQFETKVLEYNVQASVDLLHLFVLRHHTAIKWRGYAGVGQFLFSTTGYGSTETLDQDVNYKSVVPEFVYFFGSNINYAISKTVWITADLSIRQAQNDRLDLYYSEPDFDYYSYLAVGVGISINNLRKPFYRTPDCDAYDAIE